MSFFNTLKTTVGYWRGMLERWTPLDPPSNSIEEIYNYLQIEDRFATSGQPNEHQFGLIRDAGYEIVVNLAPKSVLENSLTDEDALLEKLGITYIHIPVDFFNPTEDDYSKFVSSLEENVGRKVWVHCAANMRVSAFTYRYRRAVLGEDKITAGADLHEIWEPLGVWKTFIEKSEEQDRADDAGG